MARRGFIRRIADAIRNVVAPPSPPRREPPPPPRPPAPTTGYEPPRYEPARWEYREVWREYDKPRGVNYSAHLRVFHTMVDPIEDDPQEQLELWRSYVRNIVAGEGQFRRNDNQNMFWRDSGIDPQSWRWQDWREAMGYVGNRRSRTP